MTNIGEEKRIRKYEPMDEPAEAPVEPVPVEEPQEDPVGVG